MPKYTGKRRTEDVVKYHTIFKTYKRCTVKLQNQYHISFRSSNKQIFFLFKSGKLIEMLQILNEIQIRISS